jgi:hypothetical protein
LLSAVFFLGTAVAWLSWLTHQVVVWRRSSGERRQQMKWLMTGAVVCAISGAVLVAWTDSQTTLLSVVADIASGGLAALPVQRALEPASLSVWLSGEASDPRSVRP